MLAALPKGKCDTRRTELVEKVTKIQRLMKDDYQENLGVINQISLEIADILKENCQNNFQVIHVTLSVFEKGLTQLRLKKIAAENKVQIWNLLLVKFPGAFQVFFRDDRDFFWQGTLDDKNFVLPIAFYKFMWQHGLTKEAIHELYTNGIRLDILYPPVSPMGLLSSQYLDWFMQNGETIGSGSYGTVEGYLFGDTSIVVKRSWNTHFGISRELLREAAYYTKLSHPNILSLIDVFDAFDRTGLVLPRAQNDLSKLSTNQLKVKTSVLLQTTRAVAYLHSQGVLHGDLKETNFLYFQPTEDLYHVVLADFGLAQRTSCFEVPKQEVFVYWYRAPEIILGGIYTEAADIWALGCIFFRLLTMTHIFTGETPRLVLQNIAREFGIPDESNWSGVSLLPDAAMLKTLAIPSRTLQLSRNKPQLGQFSEIITEMLQMNPIKRPTALKILNLPLFDEVRFDFEAPEIVSVDCRYAVLSEIPHILVWAKIDPEVKLYQYLQFFDLQKVYHQEDTWFANCILLYERTFRPQVNIHSHEWILAIASIIFDLYSAKSPDSFLNTSIKQVSELKLRILKLMQFNLIFSTSFDVVKTLHINYNTISLSVAQSLLFLSYLTSLSSEYDAIFIAHFIYSLAARFSDQDFSYPSGFERAEFESAEKIFLNELKPLRETSVFAKYSQISQRSPYTAEAILEKLSY